MTDDDKFFERLRADAAPLRYQDDEIALARIRANVRAQIEERARIDEPGVLSVLASWFRPLTAALAAIAIAAALVLTVAEPETRTLADDTVEIVLGGDTYRVGN